MDLSWEISDNDAGPISTLLCMRCWAPVAALFHAPGTGREAIEEEWEAHFTDVAELAKMHAKYCRGRRGTSGLP